MAGMVSLSLCRVKERERERERERESEGRDAPDLVRDHIAFLPPRRSVERGSHAFRTNKERGASHLTGGGIGCTPSNVGVGFGEPTPRRQSNRVNRCGQCTTCVDEVNVRGGREEGDMTVSQSLWAIYHGFHHKSDTHNVPVQEHTQCSRT
jgi:hypothetical protein